MIAERHRLALPAGYQLGKYRFRDVLGSGGFGITYLAEDSSLGRRVAIKELLPNDIATRIDGTTVVAKTESEEGNLSWARERFVEEGRALAACDHPNVVNVYELIEANGTAYMVTKFEDGRSLADWIRNLGRPPDEAELRGILLPLLSGLEKVHRAGFLHRDIKPENIYLTDDGRPLLLDFGSARQAITDRSMAMTSIVTSGYAPFEQYHEDGKQGAWSDIYAMGAVMYRAITGKKPPEATRRLKDDPCVKLAKAHAGAYRPQFLSAIDKALSVEPADRPQSVAAWRQMIGEGPASAPPTPNWADLLLKRFKEFLGKFEESVARMEPLPAQVRAHPLPSAAAAIIVIFFAFWMVWKVSHSTAKPIASVTTPAPVHTPAPGPTPAQLVVVAPTPNPAPAAPPLPSPTPRSTPQISIVPTPTTPVPIIPPAPAQALGPHPGQPWQNSLGIRFSPLAGGAAHMAVWKTRKSDFEAFTQATGYNANGGMSSSLVKGTKAKGLTWENPGFTQTPDHPVVGVNAYDALAFCQWLTEKEQKEGLIDKKTAYRLPTDREWSAAAGPAAYPWGETWPPADSVGNFAGNEARTALGRYGVISHYSDGFVATSPVGSFPASASGIFDLGGNALEWCGAWYQRDLNSEEVRRKVSRLDDDGDGKTKLILRGSSCFTHIPEMLRFDTRSAETPTTRADTIGFRLVLGPKDSAAIYELPRLLAPPIADRGGNPDGLANPPPGDDSDSSDKVDPRMVGIWETKGVTGGVAWTWRWDQEANGHYTYSKSVTGSGTVTAIDGKMHGFSDDTQQWSDATYQFTNTTTLVTESSLGKAVWKRVATHASSTKRRSGDSQSSDEDRHTNHEGPGKAREIIRHFFPGF